MIRFPLAYQQYATNFFEAYELEAIAISPENEINNLKDQKDRICRFCQRGFPQVTFKSKAHILPELLGNKYLVSDFECDSCNKKLGRFDQHLSHFIGLNRTLMRTEGKNGVPTLFSRNEKIKASKEKVFGTTMIKFGSTENSTEHIKYDANLQQYTITYEKKPFIPFNVYRSLLKIGLCLITSEDAKKYEVGFNLLKAKVPPGVKNPNIYSVIRHIIPGNYDSTFAYLFKRKNTAPLVPPHTMILLYKNVMLQIFLSFRIDYLMEMNGKTVDVSIFPPYFDGSGSDKWGLVSPQLIDLSSNEITSEEETISFRMAPTNQDELMCIDMNTGKPTDGKFDPNNIVGFFLDHDQRGIQLPKSDNE